MGYTVMPPGDHTALYRGLPGGVCPCPHYGYLSKGRSGCAKRLLRYQAVSGTNAAG